MSEAPRSTLSSDHIVARAKIIVAFDWLLRPRKFLETPHGITAYLSAAGCFCGAVLFLIAVCAASVPTVCQGSTYLWVRLRPTV